MSTTCSDGSPSSFGRDRAPRGASRARRRRATASRPSRSTVPRPTWSRRRREARSARGEGPIASRIATFSLGLLHRPAQQRARLLRVGGLHDRHVRQRREQRDVPEALVRLPRPGRDQPGVVAARRRPSCPRSPGCRSARSRARRGSEANELTTGSSPWRAMPAAVETMSCSAIPHSTKRSGYASSNAADAAVRGEVGVEHDELRSLAGELEQRLAVRLDDVLVRRRSAARRRRPIRARPRGRRRLLVSRRARAPRAGASGSRSRSRRQARRAARANGVVVGRAGMPAVRAAAFARARRDAP